MDKMAKFWGMIKGEVIGDSEISSFQNSIRQDPESSDSRTSLSRLEQLSNNLLLDIIELVAIP